MRLDVVAVVALLGVRVLREAMCLDVVVGLLGIFVRLPAGRDPQTFEALLLEL